MSAPAAARSATPRPGTPRAASGRPTTAPLFRLLRSEMALVVPRPRTAITLGILLVVPLLVTIALRSLDSPLGSVVGGILLSTTEFTALTLAVPVVLVAADAFAAERANRTLDQLRLAPVGIGRLVLLKTSGILVTAVLTALVTTGAALLGGFALLPLGDYTAGATLGRGLAVGAWLCGQLLAFGMLVLPLSMLIRRTAGVVTAGLAAAVLGMVPDAIRPSWLGTIAPSGNWMDATTGISGQPADWSAAGATTLRAVVYVLIGAVLTAWLLARRDE